jgi:hypothetical protein
MLLSWIRYRRQPGSVTYDQQNLLLPGRVEAALRIPPNSHCRRPLLVNGSVFRPAEDCFGRFQQLSRVLTTFLLRS